MTLETLQSLVALLPSYGDRPAVGLRQDLGLRWWSYRRLYDGACRVAASLQGRASSRASGSCCGRRTAPNGSHVGFRQGDEGKTMGLAPYGGQELLDQLRGRLRLDDDGGFTLMPGEEFKALLDRYVPARTPQGELTARH